MFIISTKYAQHVYYALCVRIWERESYLLYYKIREMSQNVDCICQNNVYTSFTWFCSFFFLTILNVYHGATFGTVSFTQKFALSIYGVNFLINCCYDIFWKFNLIFIYIFLIPRLPFFSNANSGFLLLKIYSLTVILIWKDRNWKINRIKYNMDL